MKSKSTIEKQISKKKNPELVKTIVIAKKNPKWFKVAEILSGSSRNKIVINLDKINEESKQGEIIVVPGKVLSLGNVNKKIRVAGLNFSEKAKEKLLKAGCEIVLLKDEIKNNKEAKAVKILK